MNVGMRQTYTTLDEVLLALNTGMQRGNHAPSQAREELFLWEQIEAASAQVASHTGRQFVPTREDRVITSENLYDSVTVTLPGRLVQLTGINGSDTGLGDYTLLPGTTDSAPFLKGPWALSENGGVLISGWWGYTNNWRITEQVALAIDAVTMTVSNAALYQRGDFLRLNQEMLFVTAIDSNANTLTVERGVNGTTAAAHPTQALLLHMIPSDVQSATTAIAVWLYRHRHVVAEQLALPQGGVVRTNDLSDSVYDTLDSYALKNSRVRPYGG